MTKKHVDPSCGAGEHYRFPWRETEAYTDMMDFSPTKLMARLNTLVRTHGATCRKGGYEKVRNQYLALNRALNGFDSIAPRFRPTLKSGIAWKAPRTRSANLLSNDHQVLDLDYLEVHHNHYGDLSAALPDNYQELFVHDQLNGAVELDEDTAEYFVGTGGHPSRKASDYLMLNPAQQLETRTLQTENVRSDWRRLSDKKRAIEAKLRDRGHVSNGKDWSAAWLACQLGSRLRSSDKWYKLITGDTISASSLTHISREIKGMAR